MYSKPVFTNLYEGLELSLEQEGSKTLSTFLSPRKAALLAENLLRMAREQTERDEQRACERARK